MPAVKTTCPGCGTAYRITGAHVGRSLKCKTCSAALVVTAAGLELDADTVKPTTSPEPPPTVAEYDYSAPPPTPPARPRPRPSRAAEQDTADDYDPLPRPAPRRPRGRGWWADFMTFRLMLTPAVIAVVFWLGVVLLAGAGVYGMASSFNAPVAGVRAGGAGFADDEPEVRPRVKGQKAAEPERQTRFDPQRFLGGLLICTAGPLLWRLYCETLIVFFKIHDELKDMNRRR